MCYWSYYIEAEVLVNSIFCCCCCCCLASSSLIVDNLPAVYDAVYPARTKWYQIGMGLKVAIGTLDAIKEDETSTDKRLLTTLQVWLQSGTDCSWAALKKALESPIVGRKDIASKLPPS